MDYKFRIKRKDKEARELPPPGLSAQTAHLPLLHGRPLPLPSRPRMSAPSLVCPRALCSTGPTHQHHCPLQCPCVRATTLRAPLVSSPPSSNH
jgi:hypothetical protein